ncbi:MAG: GTP 3',8-cyclase MoaA [Desulfovibrionaceae bacterium]|nr:GTP 3',8-cyclase MoaA [Desulfovibrionaceae bacterium]
MDCLSPLVDSHGRQVRYLRLSVTDRCNLRCVYCRVDKTFIPHDRVLRYEEMERIVAVAVAAGVRKLRLTGGEPFVRRGFPDFLRRLRAAQPDVDLCLTSNGILLAPYAGLLRDLGVRVNLSLDTLRPQRFERITGRDLLPRVLASMDALLKAGVPLKLNAVALRGVNDDELPGFLDLARSRPLDVRFIEFMPMGDSTVWSGRSYWPATDILRAARELCGLTPLPPHADTDGPARMYALEGGMGRFGLITPLTHHFCAGCNRLRVTSDGRLRSCLFDDHEYRLAPILRAPRLSDETLLRVMRRATLRKPIGAHMLEKRQGAAAHKAMSAIGG